VCGVLSLFLAMMTAAATTAASDDVQQWIAARLLGAAESRPVPAHLVVYSRTGAIAKDQVEGQRLRIAGREFARGLHMPAPGEIRVVLPGPAASFSATVGVDSNDVGYYSNAGRGQVVASIDAAGKRLFESPVLHEGQDGIDVRLELNGATELRLRLAAAGTRRPIDQEEWDQVDWAEARVTLRDGRTVQLADLPIGPLAPAPSVALPFSFRYDGQPSSELLKTWVFDRTSTDSRHTLQWTDPRTGLVVRLEARTYADFPTVEWTLYFENTGSAPTPILEDIQAIDTSFERDGEGEFLLHHFAGSPGNSADFQPIETPLPRKAVTRLGARGGRPTHTDLCYFNLAWPGRGVIVALGWPGQWAAEFARDEGTRIRVRAGQELTHFRLLPGEKVRTPLVALQFWTGDWVNAQNVWRRWMVAHNLPRPGGQLPPPQLSAGSARYTVEMQEADEANQKRYFESYLAQKVPIDFWWMDAGWYPFKTTWGNVGTWDPDPARFPNGLRPIVDLVHSKGRKVIVWFEPERVTPGSWLATTHPEWLLGPEGGNRLLDLGNDRARQWLIAKVSGLIEKSGIDTYRQDFNFPPLDIWRANDAPDRQGITEIKHVMGYLAYWDELRRRFPALLIDTCASGGRRNDLETLRRAVPLWRSDYAYVPDGMQQLTYGLSFWMPYFGTAINSSDPYVFRSQMTPAVALGTEPNRRNVDAAALLRFLGQWRQVSKYYYGDYYPLTPYASTSAAWMAWQFGEPSGTEGMVQAFRRADSPFESARLTLHGLDAAARYAVTDLDTAVARTFTGAELMTAGLPITIANRPGAALVVYKKE
jgi:alpha-galactosidase